MKLPLRLFHLGKKFSRLLFYRANLFSSFQHEDFLLALQVNEDEYKKVRSAKNWIHLDSFLMWFYTKSILLVQISDGFYSEKTHLQSSQFLATQESNVLVLLLV